MFPDGTELAPETAVVVFGGGMPADSIPGILQTASLGSLDLFDTGETIRVETAFGEQVLTLTTPDTVQGESITRDPDFTGPFVPHTQASSGPFSPGRTTGGAPLPVELAEFRARVEAERVHLQWRTAAETNNAGFRVQRRTAAEQSPPGRWQTLAFVDSKASGGTTTQTTTYRVATEPLPPGRHAFRLVQVDLDGATHPTDPVDVRVRMQEALQLAGPSPHPVRGPATVTVAVRDRAEARLVLYDALGRRVRQLYRGTPTPGTAHPVQLDATGLPSGLYLLRLVAGDRTETRRITVTR